MITPSVVTVTMNPAVDKTVSVDKIELAGLNRIKEVRIDAGGKGINVAKVLAGFGVKAAALAVAGGYQSRLLRDKLEQAGIPCSFEEAEGETRVNLKVVDESTRQTTEFNEPGIRVDAAVLDRFTRRFEEALEGAAYTVIGGSLPPGAPPEYYRTLIEASRKRGVPVVLDADGTAFAQGVEARPFAIKPNIHELELYFGRRLPDDGELVSAARELIREKGVRLVLVSMGGDGSILVNETEAYRARPFPIRPLSTVGAGDSMVAAMVYSLLGGRTLPEMARITSAAGTITASKPGTQVCGIEEVEAAMERVGLASI
ncbi:1-phosphofructokinase [Paenibacillus sp. YN15]|uniref:1-phosphofructokinase n=1 Tax=Paenibacillus sp. YN15 TaxID=1742774 RepID=UPI000DCE6825|nr:1-phosphofructokinase [Paenibacillus sp. YN15]RAV01739.1 1-phosphofructokinase [Paenibacillus sp. YN15]